MVSMRIYLSQHAQAMSKDEDPERPLTEQGQREIRAVCEFLTGNEAIAPAAVFHSGKRRAQQTAECIGAYTNPARGTHAAEGLSPLDDPNVWEDRLKREREDLSLVGHLPHMEKLASLLLCGDPEGGVVRFRPGGVVALERDQEGAWRLIWAVVPSLVTRHA
jgi:phosphohistidine phosphatase